MSPDVEVRVIDTSSITKGHLEFSKIISGCATKYAGMYTLSSRSGKTHVG